MTRFFKTPDNEHMNKKFTVFRSHLLFIGLAVDEMMNIETAFSRFSVYYKNSLANVNKLDIYDLICIPEADLKNHQELLDNSQTPYLVIGERYLKGSLGLLKRPIYISEWLQVINKIIEPVKTPALEKIEVGTIVRSKTTPVFGKGVIVSILNPDELMVKFPSNPLLPKDKPIRCHKSQLQILGKIDSPLLEKLPN